MCVTLSSCATIFIKSQLFILLLEQPSTGKKALRDMEDRKNTSFYREFEFKEEDNLVHVLEKFNYLERIYKPIWLKYNKATKLRKNYIMRMSPSTSPEYMLSSSSEKTLSSLKKQKR
ncbi:hypothetical protein GLYMA_09G092050v4 [Glycine max]|nr:hypothetical protein GLYMA_09G092050v4 [Glycine max]KAH1042221.1 hypothetical protein GYH30_024505 [Glycine max]|eukprot:XP_014617251.1 uncharacterized protein LOC106794474 [Glycine max]